MLPGCQDGQGHSNRRARMDERHRDLRKCGNVIEEQISKTGPSSIGALAEHMGLEKQAEAK